MEQQHQEHAEHADHWHDSACGHEATQRGDGHTDYDHDGHQHHEHDGHWDEHTEPAASVGMGGEPNRQSMAGSLL